MTPPTCSWPECPNPSNDSGMCDKHQQTLINVGVVKPDPSSYVQRRFNETERK